MIDAKKVALKTVFKTAALSRATRSVLVLFVLALAAPMAFGQAQIQTNSQGYSEHVNLGIFGDAFRVSQNQVTLGGVGARLGVNLNSYVQLEGEANYDFDQIFTETDTTGAEIQRTAFRDVAGLFGPKLQTNRGPVRLFVTAKGGVVAFHFGNGPATVGEFASTVANLRAQNLNAVFYPGGGAEAFWGPIGLRLDVGDEMYFNNGAHNNLRVTFGPTIRF
jgi:hypothetical protein